MIVVAVAELWFLAYLLRHESDVLERELELEKKLSELDVREKNVKEDFLALADMDDADKMTVQYCVSESDLIKYNTDEAITRAAKKHLAMTLAHDILHKYAPTEYTTEDGNRVFNLQLKVKQ